MPRIRPQRPVASVAVVLIFGLAATPGRAKDESSEWAKTFTVGGHPELRVDTNDANVHLMSWDQNAIEARVTSQGYRLAIQSSEEGGVRVEERQTGDRVELNVHVPTVHWSIGITYRSVRIELKVPRRGNYEVRTRDGNIDAQGVQGDLRFTSGDGHIEAEGLDGVLHATSGDGHMRIRGRFDELWLETGDGSIEARCDSGSKISNVWSLHTGDGHVNLALPADFAADLDAHTGDGHVTVNFPVTISGSVSRSEIRGKMNGGGQELRIRTGDGSIHIEKL